MGMEVEMAGLRALLGQRLIGFELSSDFVELLFENGRLVIRIFEDGLLDIRVV